MSALILFIVFLVGFLMCLRITPWVIQASKNANLVDRPGGRRSHIGDIPRTGGVAIAASFFSALFLLFLLSLLPFLQSFHFVPSIKTLSFLLGLVMITTVGFVDDVLNLPPRIKLIAQIVCVYLCVLTGLRIDFIVIGNHTLSLGYWAEIVSGFWMLLLINSINFIDGVDGLVSSIGLLAFSVILVIFLKFGALEHAVLVSLIMGTLLAFRFFNVGPARIFLGDGGSHFIGFCLSALSISSIQKGQFQIAPMMILFLVPILDLFRIAFVRLWKGVRGNPRALLKPKNYLAILAKMGEPDQGHIHHLLLRRGLEKSQVVLVLETIAFGGCLVALWLLMK